MIRSFCKKLSTSLNLSLVPRKITYIILCILVLILSTSAFLLYIQYKTVQSIAQYRLSTIAEIKKSHIENWIKDQTDDINLLINSELFAILLHNYLTSPHQENYYKLWQFLKFYAINNDINNIVIANINYSIIVSLDKSITKLDDTAISLIQKSNTEKKIIVSDIHHDESGHQLHISVIAPVFLQGSNYPAFFIIAITDARDFIIPILSQWTGLADSAETILLQKRTYQAYSINNTANLQIYDINNELSDKNTILYKYFIGSNGFLSGIDTDNKKVLSYATSVSELSWLIITKQDHFILFKQWYFMILLATIIFTLSTGVVALYLIIYSKNTEKLYYQNLLQDKNEELKHSLQYKLFLESIDDAIIVTDSYGNIEIFNKIAEALTGFTCKEVAGRYVADVVNIINKNILLYDGDIFENILEGYFYGDYRTTILLSKNNTVIPVDFKGSIIKTDDGAVLGTIIIIQDKTKENFLYLLSEIRIKFINYALQNSKDEFINYALKQIINITNSHVSCFVCYKYYFNKINALKVYSIPDSFSTHCIDDTIECSIDYERLWNECNKTRKPLVHNTSSNYFKCKNANESINIRELFVPVINDDKLVAIVGVANINNNYSEIDISRLIILADIMFEIIIHKEKEESFKNLVELSSDLACIADLYSAQFLLVNPAFEKVLGYTREELLSKSFMEFIHPDDINITQEIIKNELLKGKPVISFINRYRCKDGTYRWLDWNSYPVASLRITYATAHDIASRKEIEDILRLSEEKFKNIFIHSNDGICLHELVYDYTGIPVNYKIIDVNPRYEEILSINKEEAVGKLATEIYNSQDPPYFDIYSRIALTGSSTVFETYYEPLDKFFLISVFSPQKGQFVTVFKDITDIKLAAKKVEEAEEKFSLFMKNLPLVVVIRDINGRYIYLNDEWEKVMGLKKEDWLGKTPYDVFPKEDAEKLLEDDREAILKGTTEPAEITLTHKSGVKWWMANRFILYDADKKPAYVATLYIDITDKKKAEEERERLKEQLIQAQKLESIGRLAGGVAHDYNNMLEVILGNAQLALMQIDSKEDLKNYLQEITNAAKRSADITRQLLTFARKQISEPQVININTIIENMLKMLRRLIGEDIELEWLLDTNLWNVFVDPIQINQIIANLCVNARDAIQSNGIITIKTKNIVIDDTYCTDKPDCLPGEYVLLSVTDNGIGIDTDIIDKIFDPFFTTKEVGKGTGLGLSTVYGIVKQNNGFINVYSEKGKGSTFNIYISRYAGPDETSKESIPESWLKGKGETILVVEDEISLLKMIQIMLERLHYSVITAHTPVEALNIVQSKGKSIQLVLTDFVMPVMDGLQLSEEIKKLNPNIQFIYMSGYTDRIFYENKINRETNFLQKPFSITELAKKIRDTLEK